jgi:hypothetical protein
LDLVNRVQPSSTFELNGPDGGKLIGFLAALGALAALTEAWPDREVCLSWTQRLVWRPVLGVSPPCNEDDLVHGLHEELRRHREAPEFVQLGDDLPVDPSTFRKFAQDAAAAASLTDRRWADFSAAWGSESVVDRQGRIQDTAFRTMSGAGHQHFLGFMRELVEATEEEHLREALFGPWTYSDRRPSMRWDPFDDRRYAYRSDNPATSRAFPIHTVRGANRLAVEALRCFPTAPQGSRLATAGFAPLGPGLGEPGSVSVRWPTWRVFLGLATVKSLLVHPALWQDPLPIDGLSAMGVEEVFECQRRTDGYVRNFTPAYPLLARFESAAGPA